VAAIEHQFGKGKTLLIGTFPGGGYYLHHSPGARAFFAGLLKWAGVEQQLHTDNSTVQARLHQGPGGTYLWITNPSRAEAKVTVSLPRKSFHAANDLWDTKPVSLAGSQVIVAIPPRDAAVVALRE
jgi:beta-galactosidase